MSDTKKTIKDVLAEVQKNTELQEGKFGGKQMAVTGGLAVGAALATVPGAMDKAKEKIGKAYDEVSDKIKAGRTAPQEWKPVDEAMAMDTGPQYSPPAIVRPAAGQQKRLNVSASGKGSARFLQQQTARANQPTEKTGRSLVPSNQSRELSPSSSGGSRAVTKTGGSIQRVAPEITLSKNAVGEYGARAHTIPGSGAAAGVGARAGLNAGLGRIASTLTGPEGAIASAVAPVVGQAMKDRYREQHGPGSTLTTPHASTPGVSATDSFARMKDMKAPAPAPSAAPKADTAAPAPAPSAAAKEVPTIKAPSAPAKVAPSTSTAAPKTSSSSETSTKGGYFTHSPNVSKGDYQIKSGDTLSNIAKTHGTSVGAIQSMNKGLTDVNKIAAGGSLNLPTTTKAPQETESGKKAKKMSEEINPLIASFLDLQSKNPSNMFEAAKKAKKDYDKDGKVESEKDEVWGSRIAAAKKAGKMEEAAVDAGSVEGSKSVTKTKPAEDPSTPKSYPGAASSLTPNNPTTKRMSNAVKEEEEVTFSEAELEHINSFFLEASVAPTRPEVATGADSTSDKMSQNDVTATAESGKKIRKEEIELDEKLTDDAKTNIRTALSDKMKKSSAPARALIKLAKSNPANVKEEEELDEGTWSTSTSSNPRPMNLSSGGGLDPEKKKALAARMANYKPNMKAGESDDEYKARTAKNAASQRAAIGMKEETLEEGRPKKNPEPETTERDPRKHIQVEAGRAAAGNVVDFHHNDGSKSKITPAMGRKIVSHLNGLKPADRQSAVNKMHDSAEGLKV